MSTAVDLANAIVERINGGEYSQTLQAVRRMVPFHAPEDLTTIQVSIFTGTKSADLRVRAGDYGQAFKPVVAVQKLLQATNDAERMAESDALLTLVEEIEARLQDENLVNLVFMEFDEGESRDTYGIEAMRDHGVFATAITLTYMG